MDIIMMVSDMAGTGDECTACQVLPFRRPPLALDLH